MTDINPGSEELPINMEALLEDSIAQILKYEDPQIFVSWLRDNIDNYYSGPDIGQTNLFDNVEPLNSAAAAFDLDILRKMAINLAGMIWNGMPLPSNHFKPKPLALPGRNEPCYCGSGKKYKQCCAKLPAMPALPTSELWPMIFDKMDKETATRAIRDNHVPTSALSIIASDYLLTEHPHKAVSILAPLFEGKIRKTNDDAEYALTMLCNAYDDLGHTTKKMTLLQTILDTVSKSPLRSGAWQRMAVIRMDDGDVNGAWQAFRHAQRDDPDSLILGLLEVQILHAQGDMDKVKQRADFWVRQMRRAGVPDDDPQLNLLIEVAIDPVEAFAEVGLDMSDDAGSGLKQWLEMVRQRPLPVYTISVQQESVDVDDRMGTFREHLLSQGVSEESVELAIDSMKRQLELDTDNEDQGDEDEDDAADVFSDFYLQAPVEIQTLEQGWHRVFPFPKPFSTHDLPFGDVNPWEVDAEQEWSNWLMDHPAAFDSVDILDDLVTALTAHPQFGASWILDLLLTPLLQRSEDILDRAMASEGVVELPWYINANRPALRSLSRQIHVASARDDSAEVIQRAQKLLDINPADNHGFRTLIMNSLIYDGQDEKAIELAEEYPEDLNPEIAFGEILALYRLKRKKEAVQALAEVLEYLDKIPQYLIAKRIKQPSFDPQGVIAGGDEQAWYYRESMREEWLNTPGALDWLKNTEKVLS